MSSQISVYSTNFEISHPILRTFADCKRYEGINYPRKVVGKL
jgi:hypothetical protein